MNKTDRLCIGQSNSIQKPIPIKNLSDSVRNLTNILSIRINICRPCQAKAEIGHFWPSPVN